MVAKRLTQLSTVLLALALAGGWSSVSYAAVSGNPALQSRFLESDLGACSAPYSPLWQAPRAERVVIEGVVTGPCELGTAGCDRRPESLAEADAPSEGAKFLCRLKSEQFDATEVDGEFDAPGCLEAAQAIQIATLAISLPVSEPVRGPLCGHSDPTCRPLPALPTQMMLGSTIAIALVPSAPRFAIVPVPETLDAPPKPGSPLAGVTRRVDRPPTA